MEDKPNPYTEAFFDKQVTKSLRSARLMLAPLAALWTPDSVVDVGCGRGAWLSAWETLGARRLTGLDGPWVERSRLVSAAIDFHPTDLDQPFRLPDGYDLAMSLEVAEHCRPEASEGFVASLMALSDTVIFGAAYTDQPGANHINTRPHSFWCSKFLEKGYEVFDYFRPRFWGSQAVAPWYQQNTFIYVRPRQPLHAALLAHGERPMANPAFVDAIHPWLYDRSRGK